VTFLNTRASERLRADPSRDDYESPTCGCQDSSCPVREHPERGDDGTAAAAHERARIDEQSSRPPAHRR
jgi:hypothetical protein